MLNDYEIKRVETDSSKVNYILSLLKLVACSLAVVCSISLLPDAVDNIYEARNAMIDDSLKIRVVANSNTVEDQQLKNEIVDNLQPYFAQIQKNQIYGVDNNEAYAQIATFLGKNYGDVQVKMTFGDNLIPPKVDTELFYPQAFYQSLVLTIGDGRGDNWWCNIFSNICERSESKEEAKNSEKVEKEEKEVTFILWEWIKKLFS